MSNGINPLTRNQPHTIAEKLRHLTGARARTFQALTESPGSDTTTLATVAGLGRSTVGKILAALENEGFAVREKGDRTPGKATPDLWHPHPDTSPENQSDTADADDKDHETTPTAPTPDPDRCAPEVRPDSGEGTGAPQPPEPTGSTEAGSTPSSHDEHRAQHPAAPQEQRSDNAPAPEPRPTPTESSASHPTPQASPHADAPEAGQDKPTAASNVQATANSTETAALKARLVTPPEPGQPCPTCKHVRPSRTITASGRLRPGVLREMVQSFLADRPTEAFTATGISREIDRSSGAIYNSLLELTKAGVAQQVSDQPRRYQYAGPRNHDSDASNK